LGATYVEHGARAGDSPGARADNMAFEFKQPESPEEAIQALVQYGDEAKLIAGGTALVIMMMQRLVQPACLISLQRLWGLNRIEAENGNVHIGALATHRDVETSPLVKERLPVLAETFHHVATLRIRNVATVGGSLAHADPNQDPSVTLMALGARVQIQGAGGEREVPLEKFFVDYYQTVLRPDELLRALPKNLRNLDELDYVEPALAAFVLCHEALRSPETLGHLLLGQTSLLAGGNEEFSELDVLGGMDRLAHAGRELDAEREKLIPLSDYPK
jgi:hypothetical protein